MDKKSLVTAVTIISLAVMVATYEIWNMLSENYPIKNFPSHGNLIVAFGDSLTEGVGASSPEHGYVSVLEKRLDTTIINKGVRGDTTADALARLDADVLTLHPNTVLILLGGNDILQRIPRETTFTNLATIIDRIQLNGAVVVLIGIDGLLGNTYQKDFQQLAKDSGSLFVPHALEGIIGNEALLSDEVHPNDAGYIKLADRIAPILDGIIASVKDSSGNQFGIVSTTTSPENE